MPYKSLVALNICLAMAPLTAMQQEHPNELVQHIHEFYAAMHQEITDDQINTMIHEAQTQEEINTLFGAGSNATRLLAPWRAEYMEKFIDSMKNESPTATPIEKPCIFCKIWHGESEGMIHCDKRSMTLVNKSGYNPAHFLVVPGDHQNKLSDLSPKSRHELFKNAARLIKRCEKVLDSNGYQMFFSLAHRCAGATIPNHLHAQIMMRFAGDASPLARQLMAPLIAKEREDEFYKNFSSSKNLKRVKSLYKAFAEAIQSEAPKPIDHNSCGLCTIITQTFKDGNTFSTYILKQTYNFMVLYNPASDIEGEVIVASINHHHSFHALYSAQKSEFSDLLALAEKVVKEETGAMGISISWSFGEGTKGLFKHLVAAKVTPRYDFEPSTLPRHHDIRMDALNRTKQCQTFKEAFVRADNMTQ